MTFTIDSHIPTPMKHQGTPSKYPFNTMEIGDSFFVPNVEGKRNPAAQSAHTDGRRKGRKYVTRTEGNGLRVWRTA